MSTPENPRDESRALDLTSGDYVQAVTGRTMRPGEPGAEIVPRYQPGQLTEPISNLLADLLQPYTLNLRDWAEALFSIGEFAEADPDETSLAMLAQVLGAQSSAEALASMELDRAKELAGGEPGGHSPLLRIYGARPMKSEYEEGANCYVIVDAEVVRDAKRIRFTTGAKVVQAVILWHMANNHMPFEAILTIRSQKTRRGFYPLGLEAGG